LLCESWTITTDWELHPTPKIFFGHKGKYFHETAKKKGRLWQDAGSGSPCACFIKPGTLMKALGMNSGEAGTRK
jgi:hypothetical protein